MAKRIPQPQMFEDVKKYLEDDEIKAIIKKYIREVLEEKKN